MEIYTIIRNVHKQWRIFFYPVIYDFLALIIGLYLIGFHRESVFSIKVILEMGIPSVGDISNISLFANQITILNEFNRVHLYVIIVVISIILMRAFLQGGYIHFLSSIIRDETYSIKQFIQFGKKNWLQFTILEIIIYLLKISLTAFFIIFFPYIGGMSALIGLLILRILFIYLEFTIVENQVNIPTALKLSRGYFFKSFSQTMIIIVFMYIITSLFSLFLHKEWTLLTIYSVIFLYSYLMTLIQAVFMFVFEKVR